MSMPQHFYVAIISDRHYYAGEVAAVITSFLGCFEDECGIWPWLVATATSGSCRLALSSAMTSRGIILSPPVMPGFLNPQMIDLWIALDDYGENTARWLIGEFGPAPDRFYRRVFHDPVERFGANVPNPPGDRTLERWLDLLAILAEPWRDRLWDAFVASS